MWLSRFGRFLVVTDPLAHPPGADDLPLRPARRGRRRLRAPRAQARSRDRRLVDDCRRRARHVDRVPEAGVVSAGPSVAGRGQRSEVGVGAIDWLAGGGYNGCIDTRKEL